ncbi:MAG: hypothetical protein PHF79_01910 [Candidatus Pacebacteria bacterium]|nr:hypothetical protein [Candidatus Paceibacterota bacterium]
MKDRKEVNVLVLCENHGIHRELISSAEENNEFARVFYDGAAQPCHHDACTHLIDRLVWNFDVPTSPEQAFRDFYISRLAPFDMVVITSADEPQHGYAREIGEMIISLRHAGELFRLTNKPAQKSFATGPVMVRNLHRQSYLDSEKNRLDWRKLLKVFGAVYDARRYRAEENLYQATSLC